MSKQERQEIWQAIKQLNGKVQNNVNKRTTHILMGSCTDTQTNRQKTNTRQIVMCNKCNTPEDILSQMFTNTVTVQVQIHNNGNTLCSCNDISGVNNIAMSKNNINNNENDPPINKSLEIVNDKPRTVNALLGAVRGCRVLHAQYARDCLKAKRWLHHIGYEVPHLKKISQVRFIFLFTNYTCKCFTYIIYLNYLL